MKKSLLALSVASLAMNVMAEGVPSTELFEQHADSLGQPEVMARSVSSSSKSAANCDQNYVFVEGASLLVKPDGRSGAEDSGNIQCAVDFAKANDIRLIRLAADSYMLRDTVDVIGWTGEIQGATKSSTEVFYLPYDEERLTFAFDVRGGNVKVSRMTIEGLGGINLSPRQEMINQCKNDTGFLEVDRVVIDTVIGISAAGYSDESCTSLQLGKLTVNRSEIWSDSLGVATKDLGGGFQMNVTYNEFFQSNKDSVTAHIFNANSSVWANVHGNAFRYAEWSLYVDSETNRSESIWNVTQNRSETWSAYDEVSAYGFFSLESRLSVNVSSNTATAVYADTNYNSSLTIASNRFEGFSNWWDISVSGTTTTIVDNKKLLSVKLEDTINSTVNQDLDTFQNVANSGLLSR